MYWRKAQYRTETLMFTTGSLVKRNTKETQNYGETIKYEYFTV